MWGMGNANTDTVGGGQDQQMYVYLLIQDVLTGFYSKRGGGYSSRFSLTKFLEDCKVENTYQRSKDK